MYYMYIIFNENRSYYIGYTENLEERINSHNNCENKSTKYHSWQLAYYEAYLSKKIALKREKQLKRNCRMRELLINKLKDELE